MAKNKLPLQSSNIVNTNGKTIEETYQKKTQLEHILLRPDTYIGSVEKHVQNLWVWEDGSMVHRSVSYVPGLYKIFDEILVNAADNKQRDPKMDSLKVVIDPEQNLISVYNNGDGVPVEIHQEEGVYVPELIFGHLLTSSNYDDTVKKTTGGRNGYGAKLTNIFSTEFVIETADGKRKRMYKQVFCKNMGEKSEPTITTCKASENWTKVTFKPDLSKFNMDHLEDDVVALMKKRVIDMAGCLGKTVKVELNGEQIPVKSFKDYCELYLLSSSDESPKSEYVRVNDRWEVCVSLREGFQQVSFVNGIATIKGGTHVDYVANQIANHIAALVNRKNKNANAKANSVRNYLWVFVNALIDNPAFDSQTKETLTLRQGSFGSSCELQTDFLKKVEKIGILEAVQSWADFQQKKALAKTDGKKTKRVIVEKLDDANDAGGKDSEKCTLILTEGDSAKNLAKAGITVVGSDRYGVFPLRGKLLNVREATAKQLEENKEIKAIKQILGLQHNKQYDSVKTLRYGHLMIMTDQDYDGSHIKGLLINFIHTFWPSLLKVPSFLVEFVTPIIKAKNKNGKTLAFYSMPEYESWKKSLGDNARGWSIKYYKGLGTSTSQEGKEYFSNLDKHKKNFLWEDQRDAEAIELAFSKKKIEARKNWLRQFEPGTHLDHSVKNVRYTDFVNKELILFSISDLQRSIPSVLDGLKPGQRKILFCAFKRNLITEAKVAQFSGYVSEHSAYHHGEASLQGTIVGMAQDYVGSNNINFFLPNGQFGSRSAGGKDHASPRYIYTLLSPVARFLFPKEDDALLHYLNEDGQSIEPKWYVPIIPMVLVNGCEGIGTGWSSYIPNYNPKDIIANVRRLLLDEPMKPMDPWYKGFKGTIEKLAIKEAGNTYTVTGIVEEVDETTLRITELPVRRWTDDYKQFLSSMMALNDKVKDPFIKEMREYHDVNTVHFEIELSEENMMLAKEEGLIKRFKLTNTISTCNMHLFDPNGVIKKYETPEQIIEDFFKVRMEFYEKRKRFLLEKFEAELLKLDNKVRFILGVVSGEIIVNNRKRAELFQELRNKGFTPIPKNTTAVSGSSEVAEEESEESGSQVAAGVKAGDYDYLLSMAIGSLTHEKVQALCAEKDKINEEVVRIRNATPKSLWMDDLAALEKQLDEQDKADNTTEANNQERKKVAGSERKPPARKPQAKKAAKEAAAAEPMEVEDGSAMDTDKGVTETVKPKGRGGGSKKAAAAAKKGKESSSLVQIDEEDEDDEIQDLKDRLAAYNLDSSPDLSEAGKAQVPKVQRKEPSKRSKKPPPPKVSEINNLSDDDDDDDYNLDNNEEAEKRKKVGKKATAANAKAPAAAAAKKRGPAARSQVTGQKLITEVLKPSSPDKKVRKMRASPFNKKSGSVLAGGGGGITSVYDDGDDDEQPASGGGTEEVANFVAAARRSSRPQRVARAKATYVISDSDEDDEEDESDPEEVIEVDDDFEDDD
ncbi:unnamed protein product [Cuscuta campestris]|uniref:DNA topoisomerase 2 n=1 Tax=Cuscuta campestris TaxID=132261 RepID=A0A484LP89_9ASTE|nr:unnamed protein product [Cuscuta campestris]